MPKLIKLREDEGKWGEMPTKNQPKILVRDFEIEQFERLKVSFKEI